MPVTRQHEWRTVWTEVYYIPTPSHPATVSALQHCTLAAVATGGLWRWRRHCSPTARGRTTVIFMPSTTVTPKPHRILWNFSSERCAELMWSALRKLQGHVFLLLTEHCSWTELLVATVDQLTTNFHWRIPDCGSIDSFQQALLGPLLDNWRTGRHHAFGQDGMPFWIWHPTSFHCKRTDWTTASWTELQSTVWNELQRTGWSLYSHSESSSTDAWRCLRWLHWKSSCTDDSLLLKKKKNFTARDENDHIDLTGKVNVEITGLPISTDGVTLTITGSNWDWDWHCDLLMHWLNLLSTLGSLKMAALAHCSLRMTSHCSCWLQTAFRHWFC